MSSATGLAAVPANQKIKAGIGIIALGAVAISAWMWSQQPDWRVLYSGLSDKDGGTVIASLAQQNVPYRYTEGGGAIMVPGNRVHDVRLRLAAQGLPRGGAVGFELMENQKFGTTQFQERLNFQRGLEGELTRSIEGLAAVEKARVHLALPVQNGFLREQQKPSASILLSLHPGRTLDRQQVAGILHLVASSIPDLAPRQVSIVDQNGTLLSDLSEPRHGMDSTQIGYLRQVESQLARRVREILEPIVGPDNVRAQVTADLDFTETHSTAEIYEPNQSAESSAIRSRQTSESSERNGAANGAGGVPGALTNQPPADGTAPINGAAQATQAANNGGRNGAGGAGSSRSESVTNYEVDKTIRVTRNPTGEIRRLSVAVLVNHKQSTDADGKLVHTALTANEMQSINALVRDAVGFSQDRGDSVNVVNAVFNRATPAPTVEVPLWKDPENIALARDLGKQLGFALLALLIILMLIRPALKAANRAPPQALPAGNRPALTAQVDEDLDLPNLDDAAAPGAARNGGKIDGDPNQGIGMTIAQHNALLLARSDPTTVATVVRSWVNGAEPSAGS